MAAPERFQSGLGRLEAQVNDASYWGNALTFTEGGSGQDNASHQHKLAKLQEFFGVPKRPIEQIPGDDQPREDHSLPDAYLGSNATVTRVLIRRVEASEMWPTTEMYPLRRDESKMTFQWTTLIFNSHELSRAPPETAPRLVSNRRRQDADFLVRYNLGIMLEHEFYNTKEGAKYWAMGLLQIQQAIINTLCRQCMHYTLNADPYADNMWQTGSNPRPSQAQLETAYEREIDRTGKINKTPHGLEQLHDEMSRTLFRRARIKGNLLIIPQGMQRFVDWRPENRLFYMSGERSSDKSKSILRGNDGGVVVRESRAFPGTQDNEDWDPFYHDISFGSWSIQTWDNLRGMDEDDFRYHMMDTYLFDYRGNCFKRISFKDSLKRSGVLDDDYNVTPGIGTEYFDIVGRSNLYDTLKAQEIAEWFVRSLTRLQPSEQQDFLKIYAGEAGGYEAPGGGGLQFPSDHDEAEATAAAAMEVSIGDDEVHPSELKEDEKASDQLVRSTEKEARAVQRAMRLITSGEQDITKLNEDQRKDIFGSTRKSVDAIASHLAQLELIVPGFNSKPFKNYIGADLAVNPVKPDAVIMGSDKALTRLEAGNDSGVPTLQLISGAILGKKPEGMSPDTYIAPKSLKEAVGGGISGGFKGHGGKHGEASHSSFSAYLSSGKPFNFFPRGGISGSLREQTEKAFAGWVESLRFNNSPDALIQAIRATPRGEESDDPDDASAADDAIETARSLTSKDFKHAVSKSSGATIKMRRVAEKEINRLAMVFASLGGRSAPVGNLAVTLATGFSPDPALSETFITATSQPLTLSDLYELLPQHYGALIAINSHRYTKPSNSEIERSDAIAAEFVKAASTEQAHVGFRASLLLSALLYHATNLQLLNGLREKDKEQIIRISRIIASPTGPKMLNVIPLQQHLEAYVRSLCFIPWRLLFTPDDAEGAVREWSDNLAHVGEWGFYGGDRHYIDLPDDSNKNTFSASSFFNEQGSPNAMFDRHASRSGGSDDMGTASRFRAGGGDAAMLAFEAARLPDSARKTLGDDAYRAGQALMYWLGNRGQMGDQSRRTSKNFASRLRDAIEAGSSEDAPQLDVENLENIKSALAAAPAKFRNYKIGSAPVSTLAAAGGKIWKELLNSTQLKDTETRKARVQAAKAFRGDDYEPTAHPKRAKKSAFLNVAAGVPSTKAGFSELFVRAGRGRGSSLGPEPADEGQKAAWKKKKDEEEAPLTPEEWRGILKNMTHSDKGLYAFCLEKHLPIPIGIMIARPHITVEAGDIALLQAGAQTGESIYQRPDFQLADDVQLKIHYGHFSFYCKVIIKVFENIVVARAPYIRKYVKGGTLNFNDARSDIHIRDYREGNLEVNRDCFALAVPWNFTPEHWYMDLTGTTHKAWAEHGQKHYYPTAAIYTKLWGWEHHPENPLRRHISSEEDACLNNTILARDAVRMFSFSGADKGDHKRFVQNRGHMVSHCALQCVCVCVRVSRWISPHASVCMCVCAGQPVRWRHELLEQRQSTRIRGPSWCQQHWHFWSLVRCLSLSPCSV